MPGCFCVGPPGNCPCMRGAPPYLIPLPTFHEPLKKLEPFGLFDYVDLEFSSGFFTDVERFVDKNGVEIHLGCVAWNSIGLLGLITSPGPQDFTYPDGNVAKTWQGIQLRYDYFRDQENPQRIVNVEPGGCWTGREPIVDVPLTKIITAEYNVEEIKMGMEEGFIFTKPKEIEV